MVYLGTEYYDFRIVFVFSSIFGINYECGYSLCVEKCSGMPKSCVEKCSEMVKSCVEKCSEVPKTCVEKCSKLLFLCVEKCIFAAVLCVEKCNCHGENSAKTACGMEE